MMMNQIKAVALLEHLCKQWQKESLVSLVRNVYYIQVQESFS